MSTAGLSKPRLERIHRVLSGYVERQEMPGLVALVSRHDDVHIETLGTLAFGHPAPMRRDTIFRIASLTKPVTAVAAMILVEECKLRLDESIEPWLPELAHRHVLKSLASPIDDTVPAAARDYRPRPAHLHHGLRQRDGDAWHLPDFRNSSATIASAAMARSNRPHAPGTDEWLRNLGALPLMAQPGERWMYHLSGDVLGVLIARVSGQSLVAFLHERIFEPLGMSDTAFFVPPANIDRLPACYTFNRSDEHVGSVRRPGKQLLADSDRRSNLPAGGLVSSIDDYFAFSRMMLNKGRHGREHILSRATVELMTSDQVTPEQRAGSEIFFGSRSPVGVSAWQWTSAERPLSHARPLRLDWRLRYNGIH